MTNNALAQRKGTIYVLESPLMLSGAFKLYYEWSMHCPAVDGGLLRSSSSFNFMLAIEGLYQQGHLADDMKCLDSRLRRDEYLTSYSKSLQSLQGYLACCEHRLSDLTLGKCLLLAFHARMFDINNERTDGMTHTKGLYAIIQARDSVYVRSDQAQQLFRACRILLLYAALHQKWPPPVLPYSWSRDLEYYPSNSSIDRLTSILRTACDISWIIGTLRDGDRVQRLLPDFDHCVRSLDKWYRAIRHRSGWELINHRVAESRCPFRSFLTFSNPLAAESYSIFYTILLILSRLVDSTSELWPPGRKADNVLPRLDTLLLASEIGRMTPYFVAGGVLGYYVIEFPARFALRCFIDGGMHQHQLWLQAAMNRTKLDPLTTVQYGSENTRGHLCIDG